MYGQRRRLGADHAAAVLRKAHLGPFDRTVAALAAELPEDLAELGGAGGSYGVALRQEAAAGVDGHLAPQLRGAAVDEAAALAGAFGHVGEFGDVVHADLVVQATSIGMAEADPSAIDSALMHEGQVVAELIYHPVITQTMRAGAEAGVKIITSWGHHWYRA